jgi:DHA1 family bicyclomycin/chloramphenicol resistance-like MFS transporter
MSQVSMIFGIAPAIAPIIGGWLLGWSRWPMIFWFLVAFALVLLAATWLVLPETHPRDARLPFVARSLLRDYAAIFVNPRFQRLAAAASFNFSALFLYIASAPVFVLDMLRLHGRHLGQTQFGWFFVPTIGGMVLGAFVSGRAAGRMSGDRLVRLGFAASGVAMLYNVLYNLIVPVPAVPWAVLPTSLHAFGIALVFPVLTLAILDMYPRQRGSASSLQAFTSLVMNAVIAGVVSPLISHDTRRLAFVAAAMTLAGYGFWRWEAACAQRQALRCDGADLPPS